MKPERDETLQLVRGGDKRKYAVYDLSKQLPKSYHAFNLQGTYSDVIKYSDMAAPPVYAHRYVTGITRQNILYKLRYIIVYA